jgi:P27 family predicted phage terminase small subunit
MATRGRKPKPSHLKLVTGNPGRRPLNEQEPRPPKKLPDPPAHLSAAALEEWQRVAPMLNTLGVLTLADRGVLATYCQSWGRLCQAESALAKLARADPNGHGLIVKTKNGNAVQNPLVGIANKAANDMARFAAELGMTPSARSRVKVGDGEAADPADSYFSA